MDEVIEAMAEGSKQTNEDLNPFKGTHGEILPKDVERNFSGFLIRKNALSFKVDSVKLIAVLRFLRKFF